MGDLVNLNRARKQRIHQESAGKTAHNRNQHGRSKADRLAADLANRRAARKLDGQRMGADDRPQGGSESEDK